MKRILTVAALAIALCAPLAHAATANMTGKVEAVAGAGATPTTYVLTINIAAVTGSRTLPSGVSIEYNLYAATGVCPTSGLGTLTWTQVNTSPLAAGNFTQSSIPAGTQSCWYATAFYSDTLAASGPSNLFQLDTTGPPSPVITGSYH